MESRQGGVKAVWRNDWVELMLFGIKALLSQDWVELRLYVVKTG